MKMKQIIAVTGLLLLFSVPALADSISPTTFSATLGVGESVTVHKTVTVDEEPPSDVPVDVFFLADTTGSMGGEITAVRNAATSIMSSVSGLGDLAFGVGEYRDIYDSFTYRLNQDITTSTAAAQAGINNWSASGGGDTPEAQMIALTQLATGTSWRTGSTRIVVWFGDAPGHDPRNGYTEVGATAALVANNISVEALDTGSLNSTGQASRIASATGGHYYSGINSTNVVTTITNAIGTAMSTYSSVALDLSDVPVGITAVSSPGFYGGSWTREATRTFEFDLTFTLDAPGTYDFPVYALVDGGRVARETDSISVVPVPGAVLLGMLGLSVAGARLRKRT